MDAHRGGTAVDAGYGPSAGRSGVRMPVSPPRPRSRKAAPRPVPERDQAYEHLSLEGLRAYRATLAEEENRVSYWRRILQARLDVLRAGLAGGTARPVDTAALRPVLTDARVGAGRRVLVDVLPAVDMPPLPQLERLWDQQVDLADVPAAEAHERELARAERELSDYRAALHRRIADATGELIARYRESPSLCLSALPLVPEPRLAAG
jgi:hypothetical protein